MTPEPQWPTEAELTARPWWEEAAPDAWDAPGYVPDFYFWTPENCPEAALAPQEKPDPWYWPGQDGEPPSMEELGLDPHFLPDGKAYDAYLMACEDAAMNLEIAAVDASIAQEEAEETAWVDALARNDREWLRRDPRWQRMQWQDALRRKPARSSLHALRPQRHGRASARRRRETAGRRTQRARAPARSDPDDPDPPRVARHLGGRVSVVRWRAG
jgi:hypothetical protein